MSKSKKIIIISVTAFLILLAAGILAVCLYGKSGTNDNQKQVSEEQADKNSNTNDKQSVKLMEIPDDVIAVKNQEDKAQVTLKQDGSDVSGQGAKVTGNKVTINKGGRYSISGKLEEGRIYVDAGGDDIVVLSLCGVDITNSEEAAIHIENSGYTAIVLEENTENKIQSGKTVDIDKMEDTEEDKTGGALYSRDDLALTGTGKLSISGYINNGIHTTNNLVIDSGDISVKAVNNGIKGKDSVSVSGGKILIDSAGDGIKSNDTTGEGYGYIVIAGGDFSIESKNDALQAETELNISGGNFNVISGGGSNDVVYSPDDGWGKADSGWDMEEEKENSTKGFKSGTKTIITGGEFVVDSKDDAIHSNGSVMITGGNISVASGDDGIHADNELTIDDGTVKVTRSYEGLEGNQISVNGGDISVVSSDDGMNAYGGSNNMGFGGSQKTTDKMPNLRIAGGKIYVNAEGDGIDSNGNLIVEGGEIVVDGPSGNGNGALDTGSESGGKCMVNGGTIIAVGSSGMAETFEESSGQYSFCCNLSSEFSEGDKIVITDKDGKEICSHTAVKSGSSVVFSSKELAKGETYTLRAGDVSEEITLDNVSTTSGEIRGGHMGGGHMGGGPRDGGAPHDGDGFRR